MYIFLRMFPRRSSGNISAFAIRKTHNNTNTSQTNQMADATVYHARLGEETLPQLAMGTTPDHNRTDQRPDFTQQYNTRQIAHPL